ncbi:uncharacterized protein Eint_090230 [Encephalitozoon intestinalis ATCC 50506]|uniref:Uncharacterized protein n=1 Tax=Encephalitozoon intestinalis (strain ATCC 50506) TaxID=876142 RepID=E0S960_ENCIT|nr:uncharacterized protein Eint_090230 [Encephalitozoon intestinalis ATCC 50506]ADM12153.1 hypothetical protein Eint_090230 [Encephalitozoon intestinalis ATCC 50506]UTX45954.1 DUF5095 domain-containing protein [Encephalitozoon intestinalis]
MEGTWNHNVKDEDGGKLNRSSGIDEKIDILSKVSDNPFDVLSRSLYKKIKISNEECPVGDNRMEDAIFEELLVRNKEKPKVEDEKILYGIFTSMVLMADIEIQAQEQKMYKFPFELETKNDGSPLFRRMYSEYLIAIKSAFREYKKNNTKFCVKLKNNFLLFDSCLKATAGLKKELIRNEIVFEEEGSFLIIKGLEIALVFDYIVNIPISSSFCIPFILSQNPFENGILFSVKLQKKRAIREGKRILYSYELLGPFWADDYKDLIPFCTKIT